MNRIWMFIRRVGLEIYCFLTAPLVAKNCLGMLTFITMFFVLTMWWLNCYTNHGQSILVPNYVGMNYREAARKATASGFVPSINDSIYMEGKTAGEIISHNPKANSNVKEGRTIYFIVAKGAADLVRLPGLVGNDDYDLYSRQCARLGVKTRISARIQDSAEPNTILSVIHRKDTVTSLIRSGGYQVEVGALLEFVVSEAGASDISVPECVCQTFDAAKFLISSSGLALGTVIKDASVTDIESAYVWRQSPAYDPNGRINLGQSIDLFLTQSPPQGCQ